MVVMTYQSLYRKYRPNTFDDVIGQKNIVKSLQNAIKLNKISHAYIFTGPRGTGKTTMAKLLAKAINCEDANTYICGTCDNCLQEQTGTHPDIVEIDAASNNGVDEIRNLIERVKFTPIVGKYKVYIIDEVHMLTMGAFNALLKTLEEPPSHVVFILATTEIHKVLPTIISRCQRFDFSRISENDISDRLEYIVDKEHRTIEDGASRVIASLSGGGLRNALTILEQAMILNEGNILKNSIYTQNGMVLPQEKAALFESIYKNDIERMLKLYHNIQEKTVDVPRFVMDLVKSVKDSLIYQNLKNFDFVDQNDEVLILALNDMFNTETRLEIINILLDYHEKIRFSSTPSLHLEIAFIEMFEKFNKNQSNHKVDKVKKEAPVMSFNELTQKQEAVVAVKQEVPELDLKDEVAERINETPQFEINDDTPEVDTHEIVEPIVETEPIEKIEQKQSDREPQVSLMDVKPQEPTEEVVVQRNKLDLTTEEIVQFMVSADKTARHKDTQSYMEIKSYLSNPKWAKESKLLNNSQLVLSGNAFVVVATKNQIQARSVLDENNLFGLLAFSEIIFGKPKQIFATTAANFTVAVELFKDLSANKQLPDPFTDDDFITTFEEKKGETEERLLNLFGDKIEIKE